MDLLFKRYASPFLFIDGYLQTGRFSEFVVEFVKTINAEKEDSTQWEFYLHKVQEGTFGEFVEEIENNKQLQNMPEAAKEEAVKKAFDILNKFNPERGEEQNGTI